MSIFESLGRYRAAIMKARKTYRSLRILNDLPPEIQKDIGWPVSPRSSEKNRLPWDSAR